MAGNTTQVLLMLRCQGNRNQELLSLFWIQKKPRKTKRSINNSTSHHSLSHHITTHHITSHHITSHYSMLECMNHNNSRTQEIIDNSNQKSSIFQTSKLQILGQRLLDIGRFNTVLRHKMPLSFSLSFYNSTQRGQLPVVMQ